MQLMGMLIFQFQLLSSGERDVVSVIISKGEKKGMNVKGHLIFPSSRTDTLTPSSVNVKNISNPHAGLFNNAGPTSEKLLQFRHSFLSVMDPPRKYYVLCLRGRV
jgi:hypothetical protein